MRKISAVLVLMTVWYSAWAFSPVGGGEDKQSKVSDGQKVLGTGNTANPGSEMDMLLEEVAAQDNHQVASQPENDDAVSKQRPSTPVRYASLRSKKEASASNASNTSVRDARKELKSSLKQLKKKDSPSGPSNTAADDMLVICVILCFFIPPLAVYLWENSIGINFWISLILTLLFWVPGVIFSLIVVLTT